MRVGVLVGHVAQVLGPRIVEDLRERGPFIGAGWKLAVTVIDGHLVPVADARLVGLG